MRLETKEITGKSLRDRESTGCLLTGFIDLGSPVAHPSFALFAKGLGAKGRMAIMRLSPRAGLLWVC
jgi:hypothetical protein